MVWQKILLLSLALFLGNTKAFRKRIINSHLAEIENYPYQVSLQTSENEHFCGGSIISEKYILTAGHCFTMHDITKPPYDGLAVLTGSSFFGKGGRQYEFVNVTIHPDIECNETRCVNDIAVVTLKDAIVFDKYTQKISLPKQNYKPGQKVNITGWGLIQQVPTEMETEQLRSIEAKLISMEECQKKVPHPTETPIYETEVCAFHSKGTGVCFGDSGGPLAANGEVVGITAWGDGEHCGDGYPDVFTNVYKYLDYINSVTN